MFGSTPTASNQEVEPGTAKVHQRQPVRNVEHSFWLVRKVIAPPTCGFAAGRLCPTRKGSLVRAQQRPQRKMQVMGHLRPGWEPGSPYCPPVPHFSHAAGVSAFVLEQPRPSGATEVQQGSTGCGLRTRAGSFPAPRRWAWCEGPAAEPRRLSAL